MSLSQPIMPQSLVNDAFERLAEAIASGEIKPGERVRETQLASQLGVSRAVLREALRRLESLWLITRTPNVGAQVVRHSQQDLYELYAMLEALVGLAARSAATLMPDEEIEELRALLEEEAGRPDTDQSLAALTAEEFHYRIARGSRNARLERMVCEELRHQLRFYSQIPVRPGWASAALAERRDVLHAIERGDSDGAEAAIRVHIRHWRANFLFTDLQDDDYAQETGQLMTVDTLRR